MKIGFISDTHSGSTTGLTVNPRNSIQEAVLKVYESDCAWLGKCDILIHLGDIIDGEDLKIRDLTENELPSQVTDAVETLRMVKAKEYMLIAGTPYHVSQGAQNWDKCVINQLTAAKVKASYHDKLKLQVSDWFYVQCRHKVGSSGIPHGRFTSPARSKTWDAVNAAIKANATGETVHLANLLVFGHVHYWTYAEDAQGAACTLPCYQALGGRYGSMMCDGHVDLGCLKVEVGAKGEWSWEKRIHQPSMISRTVKR